MTGWTIPRSESWDAAFGRTEALTGFPRLINVLLYIILFTSALFVYRASAKMLNNANRLRTYCWPSRFRRKYIRVSAAAEARNNKFACWMTFVVHDGLDCGITLPASPAARPAGPNVQDAVFYLVFLSDPGQWLGVYIRHGHTAVFRVCSVVSDRSFTKYNYLLVSFSQMLGYD